MYSLISDVDVENGHIGYIGDLEADVEGIETHEFLAPTADLINKNRVILVANPEWDYDECKRSNQALYNFVNEADRPFRGFDLIAHDMYAVTAEGIDTGDAEVEIGKYVIAQDGKTSVKMVDESGIAGQGFYGKIVGSAKRCRWISEEMGKAQNDPCIMNLWIHDGSKEVPASRLKYRQILEKSLDEIFAVDYKNMKDCIEAKLFGIGLESYTVGSYDFYLGYGVKNQKMVTLDTGHFHLSESIADKISSLLLFTPEIMLHVSRPIRWDSDHVVVMNDELLDLSRELVRSGALDRIHIGLDYFDATINRIGAYVIGVRAAQKALLQALLEPSALLQEYEDSGCLFQRLALQEEAKNMPWNAVWDMFCMKNEVPVGNGYITEIERYENEVTGKRM